MKAVRRRNARYWIRFLSIYIVAVFIALYFVVPVALVYFFAHPPRFAVCCATPADFGRSYETVTFPASDGVKLSGWYIPSQNGAAIIAVHANQGNRTGVLYHADVLAKHGYGVLLFDVRGFGESEGTLYPYPAGGLAEDVLGAVTYLQSRPEVKPDRIGAMGLSMGAVLVLRAAAMTETIRAVMADGADEVTQADMAADWPPLPYHLYIKPVWGVSMWLMGIKTDTPGPLISAMIAKVAPRPVFLIAAGSKAEIEDNRMFYQLAGEPKMLWELPDTAHIGGLFAQAEDYQQKMVTFFDQALLEGQ